jgi:TfoX/Sxy family transcriptional regulator of competence genes
MAYDEPLAERVQAIMSNQPGLESKKMFGGVGFLLHGNMACGVHKELLIVRVGPENYEAALEQAHTHLFDITGRPMSGWVMVSAPGYQTDQELQNWVNRGVSFALTLPPK